jgi:hypothetical protein
LSHLDEAKQIPRKTTMKIIAPALVVICLLTVILFSYYDKKGTPPILVAGAIITCTQTVCKTQATSSACAQLTVAITGCLSSGINAAVCLAGVPALASVGYADVVCVVAALATVSPKTIARSPISKSASKSENKSGEIPDKTPNVQQQAIEWLRTQQVTVVP